MIFLEVNSTGLLSRLLSNELMAISLVASEADLVSREWGAGGDGTRDHRIKSSFHLVR